VSTIVSRSTAYISPAEFLKRADPRIVVKLCTDDIANPATTASLTTNDYLLAALRDASGLLESAVLLGERYSVDDLTSLANPSSQTNATGLFYRILSDIAMAHLYELRPEMAPSPSMSARIERASRWLDELSNGRKIFGLQEVAEAGHMDHQEVDADDTDRFHGQVQVANRLYGRRSEDFEP